jgi:uncharacterized protein YecT (DUF1311 family)
VDVYQLPFAADLLRRRLKQWSVMPMSKGIGHVVTLALLVLTSCASNESAREGSSPLVSAGDPSYEDCDHLPQQQMNGCFAEQARHADDRLTGLVDGLRAVLGKGEHDQLLDIQSEWLQFKDDHCDWEASFYEGGSLQPTILSTCEVRLTWDRIDMLKSYLCSGELHAQCPESAKYSRPSGSEAP